MGATKKVESNSEKRDNPSILKMIFYKFNKKTQINCLDVDSNYV